MIKCDRDLLVIPGDRNGELDPGWILCNVADRWIEIRTGS